ncbi:MAG: protein translocase SEC61 complex subunit gamma [Desulfurococcaceae archaeon]|jgi:protein transport protein SEC61 subunit gamma-like protein|nr:protein translocase SEC61 complex subunit gamma [Desulfurococcaceae archaeon]
MRLEEIVAMWRKIIAISEKPESDEYRTLLKITLGGMLLVGLVGFVVHLILSYVQGYL